MSSEDPIRQVPDELFRRVSAKPERSMPDALFGPPPVKKPVEPVAESVEPGAAGGGESALPAAESAPGATESVADAVSSGGDVPSGRAGEPSGERGTDESASAVAGSEVASDSAEGVADSGVRAGGDGESSGAVDAVGETGSVAAQSVESAGAVAGVAGESLEPSESVGATAQSVLADGDESAGSVDEAAEPVVAGGSAESAGGAAESVVGHTVSEASAPEVAAGSTGSSAESGGSASDAEVSVTESGAAGASEGAIESVNAAAARGELEQSARPVLLVIADSLSYFGPKGGLPADHPQIWPNLVAAELDWDVELVGRIGWTCRDAYWALIGDPRIWAVVPRAGAVVFAVGGMDTLPSPLPTALRELIRYVRPPVLRRGVRATYNWLQPKLARLGRPVALPPKVSVDYLEQSREALAQLRPGLPVVAVLPSVHNCAAYGRVHSGRERAVKALREWSGRTSVPLVDLGEAVRDNIFSGDANPDGIHWGWAGHSAVANAMVKTLQEVR